MEVWRATDFVRPASGEAHRIRRQSPNVRSTSLGGINEDSGTGSRGPVDRLVEACAGGGR